MICLLTTNYDLEYFELNTEKWNEKIKITEDEKTDFQENFDIMVTEIVRKNQKHTGWFK